MFLGTGRGLFRVARRDAAPERIVGQLTTSQGAGSVSSNLLVRASRPGELLASGHPEGQGTLPENLGIIRSVDGGRTWSAVAQTGEADFHQLELAGGRIVAVKADQGDMLVSGDGGRTFQTRTPPAPPVDLAVDPRDSRQMVVTTEQGMFTSSDEGRSWRPRDPTPGGQVAWAASGAVYAARESGDVRTSADGGHQWTGRGSLGIGPTELIAAADGKLYASVAGGEVRFSPDGGKTWKRYVKLS